MLKEYLFGLLTGRLAQKVIVSQEKFRIRNILLSAWLVCEETMVFFIVKDYSREDYFLILEQLVVHMLVDTPTQDTEYTVHEMISKLRNAGKN